MKFNKRDRVIQNSSKTNSQFEKMTKTPVQKLIVQLAVPSIISMLVTTIYNLVDTAFVGTLGNSASGAIGIVFGFMSILQAIGFLFGQGSGSVISRLLGQRKTSEATEYASTGFFLAFFIAAIVSVLSFIFLDDIILFLGSTDTIAPYAKIYIGYILSTAPFQVVSFTMNNILRYEGKAFYGMIGLFSGAIINIAGDAIFMFGMNMGIKGAGLSTAISQFLSFVFLLIPFLTGKTQTKLSIINFKVNKIMIDIFTTGAPSLIRQGINSVSTILLNFVSKPYGDEAIAAMSIVSRIFFFVVSIAIGVGQGFQPVSGFNYGAKKYGRLRKAYGFTILLSTILVTIFGIIIFILAPQLVKLFRDDDKVIKIAVFALRFQCAGIIFLPYCMTSEMMLQTTGQIIQASFLSACRSGLVLIPLLIILVHFFGLLGIQTAQGCAFVLTTIPTAIMAISFFNKTPKIDE